MSCPGFYHIATIYLPPPPFFPFFFLSVSFFRSRSFLIVVSKLRRWSLVSSRNRSFYSTDLSIIPPRHFTMVQRPSDDPLSLSPPPCTRRVNFLQIGILLQFASSSIILAPPRSPPPRPCSRLKLLFTPPLSIPPLVSAYSADLGCLQSIRDLSKCR